MEVSTMRGTYETGPLGPETARTIREIEAENSHAHPVYDRIMVRYCSHPDGHSPKDCPDTRGETPVRVTWTCDECGERIRGFAGSIGVCSYCETWQDAPDETQA